MDLIQSAEDLNEKFKEKAEAFYERYAPLIDPVKNNGIIFKSGAKKFGSDDLYALGSMLFQYEEYAKMMEGSGSASDLGALPAIALDVIAASYGLGILPLIASIQPIDEEHGMVYYKKTTADITRGDVTADDVLFDAKTGRPNKPQAYAGEEILQEDIGDTASGTQIYNETITYTPIRKRTVKIEVTLTGGTLSAVDDGDGNIMGVGLHGTVNYTTGAVALNLVNDPLETADILATYSTDFEESANTDIPSLTMELTSTDIYARIFALKTEAGIFKGYSLKKRFGQLVDDEMAKDLTNEINAEVGDRFIQLIIDNTTGTTVSWNKTPDTGVSWYEHKQEMLDKIMELDGAIYTNSGRGGLSVLVAGKTFVTHLSTFPGYQQVLNRNNVGPQLHGIWNNINVIRSATVADAKAYGVYRGNGVFEAAAVYAPYMPLFVTSTLTSPTNVLRNMKLAAVWAGMKAVVPQFINEFEITTS